MPAVFQRLSFMRAWTVLALLPLLAGCTDSDWNRLLSFGPSGNNLRAAPVATARRTAVATAAPVAAPASASAPASAPAAAAAAQPDPFCLGIARQDATTNDFDPSTQQKAVVSSYQQCVQIFGN